MPASFIPSTPLVRVPEPPRPPKKRHILRTTLITGVVVVLLALVVLAIVEPHIQSFVFRVMAQRFLSAEMQSMQYISDTDTATQYVRMQGPTTFSFDQQPGMVVSLDTRAAYAAIIKKAAVYEMRTAKDTVYTDTRPLSGVGRSTDGRYIAVSRQASTTQEGKSPLYWDLDVFDTQSSSFKSIGVGSMPVFLDAVHLIYVSPAGITAVDVMQGTSTLLYALAHAQAIQSAVSSPNRMYLGLVDPVSNELVVFKIEEKRALILASLPRTTEDRAYALGDHGIYVLRSEKAGFGVWYGEFGEQVRRVLPLPAQLRITRLGIGAI